MSHISIIEDLPLDLQLPMIKVLDAFERDMSRKLAVRQDFDDLREDFNKGQKRTEERSDRLETALVELAEAQNRTEKRLDRLEIVVAELAEAQKRTELRVNELAEAQKRTEERLERLETVVAELAEAQRRTEVSLLDMSKTVKSLSDKQAQLTGAELERNYRNKSHAYLGTVMRRVRPVSWLEIEDTLDAHLSDAEINELGLLDVMLRGRLKDQPDTEVWLAIEVSYVVDKRDVERALQRAALLRKAGHCVIPAVAGKDVTMGGRDTAREKNVFLLQNGKKLFWEEALGEAL